LDSVKDYYVLRIGQRNEWIGVDKQRREVGVGNPEYPYTFKLITPKVLKPSICAFRESEIIRKLEPWEVVTKKMLGEL
jgi:hypothetical protein